MNNEEKKPHPASVVLSNPIIIVPGSYLKVSSPNDCGRKIHIDIIHTTDGSFRILVKDNSTKILQDWTMYDTIKDFSEAEKTQ